MMLSSLNQKGTAPDIVLLQCPSSVLSMFIEDKVKSMLNSTQDTVFKLKTKKDLKDLHMICNIQPFQSKKWMYIVDVDSFNPDKEFYNLVKSSTTVCYFMTCSKYMSYKRVKEAVKGCGEVMDFYLSYLKGADLGYLHTEYVIKTGKNELLSREMYQYLKDGYSSDVDAVMTLLDYIRTAPADEKPVTKQLITELCGLGGNTLESFVLTLLKPAPKATERSFEVTMRNRFRAGAELAKAYDEDWGKFGNYLNKIVYNIMCIKELQISNAIYKSIRDLPDGYDEKTLARYNRYLWRIKEIPMSRVLRLKAVLSEHQWSDALDFTHFMYKYYEVQVVSETLLRAN